MRDPPRYFAEICTNRPFASPRARSAPRNSATFAKQRSPCRKAPRAPSAKLDAPTGRADARPPPPNRSLRSLRGRSHLASSGVRKTERVLTRHPGKTKPCRVNRTLIAVVLAVLTTSACDKGNKDSKESAAASGSAKSAPSAAPSTEKEKVPVDKGKDGAENVELAEAYAKDVCECKTAQCINKAGDKYREASDKMYADGQIRTPTPEQKKKMDDASARVSECTDKLLKKK